MAARSEAARHRGDLGAPGLRKPPPPRTNEVLKIPKLAARKKKKTKRRSRTDGCFELRGLRASGSLSCAWDVCSGFPSRVQAPNYTASSARPQVAQGLFFFSLKAGSLSCVSVGTWDQNSPRPCWMAAPGLDRLHIQAATVLRPRPKQPALQGLPGSPRPAPVPPRALGPWKVTAPAWDSLRR